MGDRSDTCEACRCLSAFCCGDHPARVTRLVRTLLLYVGRTSRPRFQSGLQRCIQTSTLRRFSELHRYSSDSLQSVTEYYYRRLAVVKTEFTTRDSLAAYTTQPTIGRSKNHNKLDKDETGRGAESAGSGEAEGKSTVEGSADKPRNTATLVLNTVSLLPEKSPFSTGIFDSRYQLYPLPADRPRSRRSPSRSHQCERSHWRKNPILQAFGHQMRGCCVGECYL